MVDVVLAIEEKPGPFCDADSGGEGRGGNYGVPKLADGGGSDQGADWEVGKDQFG